MALDSQVQKLLDDFNASGRPDSSVLTCAEIRARSDAMAALLPPGPQMAQIIDEQIPVVGGSILVRYYVPAGQKRALLAYLHGGGWVAGSVQNYDAANRMLAQLTQSIVAAIDYRLAPEHPFPGPLDDCATAVSWIAADAPARFGAELPLFVAGDSAGGNLAGAVTMLARDRSDPAIRGLVMIYPVTDACFDTKSYRDFGTGMLLTRAAMRAFWTHYAPSEEARNSPLASILRAVDLSGLPPALVQTAAYDPLRDEGEAFAARLAEAGVAVRLERVAGMIHGYMTLATLLDSTAPAIRSIANFIDEVAANGDRAHALEL